MASDGSCLRLVCVARKSSCLGCVASNNSLPRFCTANDKSRLGLVYVESDVSSLGCVFVLNSFCLGCVFVVNNSSCLVVCLC